MNATLRGLLNLAYVLVLIPVLLVKALLRRQPTSDTVLAFFHPYWCVHVGCLRVPSALPLTRAAIAAMTAVAASAFCGASCVPQCACTATT